MSFDLFTNRDDLLRHAIDSQLHLLSEDQNEWDPNRCRKGRYGEEDDPGGNVKSRLKPGATWYGEEDFFFKRSPGGKDPHLNILLKKLSKPRVTAKTVTGYGEEDDPSGYLLSHCLDPYVVVTHSCGFQRAFSYWVQPLEDGSTGYLQPIWMASYFLSPDVASF